MQQATTTGTGKYEALLERCRSLAPVPTAVAYPCEESALAGPVEAAKYKLIVPILVGPAAKIEETARAAGIDLAGLEIVDVPDAHAAAERAVALVREGRAEVLMKGSLHTDELLSAVVSREKGLRTGRRISHAFLMDVPTYHKVLVVTDAAINIAPTLEDKVDICQNAIDLARSLGVKQPKVAVLAAVETVNSKMPATLDAAALCKMADRGQIKGGAGGRPVGVRQRDQQGGGDDQGDHGPRWPATRTSCSPRTWRPANILAKQLSFLANADSAGLVLGARVPIILTSRADSVRSRIASSRRGPGGPRPRAAK